MRKFWTWSIRSDSDWKIEYYWFRHPLLELSFWKYMMWHQIQEDWKKRDSNNWWKWWSEDVSLQSMVRHVEDLTALHSWYRVIKVYTKQWEETLYVNNDFNTNKLKWKVKEITKEDCCNAIRFNSGSYLLEELKNEQWH